MAISLETLALAKQYADKVAATGSSGEVIQGIIDDAVAQSKIYTDAAIKDLSALRVFIVESLPTENINPNAIYFVAIKLNTSENNSYYEYMYINNKWELIGTTQIDLSNYWTIEQIKEYLNNNTYKLPVATTTTLGGVKVDGSSILISPAGIISTNNLTTESIAQEVVDANFTSVSQVEINTLFQS